MGRRNFRQSPNVLSGLFYQQSWALMYFLDTFDEGRYRNGLLDCFARVLRGGDDAELAAVAFRRAFKLKTDSDWEKLEREFHGYVRDHITKLNPDAYDYEPPPPGVWRTLEAAGRNGDTSPRADPGTRPDWANVSSEQLAAAEKHGVPAWFENAIGMRFVLVPAGTYRMGSPEREAGHAKDETHHRVTLSEPFYVQVTEVTNEELWRLFPNHDSYQSFNAEKQPAVRVQWTEAEAFAQWVSALDPAHAYSLPTEAQWEYACRAGSPLAYAASGQIRASVAVFRYEAGRDGARPRHTADVGTRVPNAWALYDMHGNAAEWCRDWYGTYDQGRVTDPLGPADGTHRVHRGGAWSSRAVDVRFAARARASQAEQSTDLGFRLVCALPK